MDLKRVDEGADTDLMLQFCLPNYVLSQGVRICLAATLPYSICSTQH